MRLTDLPTPPVTPVPGPPAVRPGSAAVAAADPAFGDILQRLSAGLGGEAKGPPVPAGDKAAQPAAEAPDSSGAPPPLAAPLDPPMPVRPKAEKAADIGEPLSETEPKATPAGQDDGAEAAEPASVQIPAVPAWFAPLPLPVEAPPVGLAAGTEMAEGRATAESALLPGQEKAAVPAPVAGPVAGPSEDPRSLAKGLPEAQESRLSKDMPGRPPGAAQEATLQAPSSAQAPVVAGATVPPPAAVSISLTPRALAGLARDRADHRSDDIASTTAVATGTIPAAQPTDIRLVAPPASFAALLPASAGAQRSGRDPDQNNSPGLDAVSDLAGPGGTAPAPASAGSSPPASVFDAPRLPLRPMAVALASHPGEQVELLLAPEELGRVRLVMHTGEGGVSVHVMADRPETLDLMRRNVAELATELEAMGFSGASFAFGGDAQQDRPAPTLPPALAASGLGGPFHSLPPAVAPPARTSVGGLDLRL